MRTFFKQAAISLLCLLCAGAALAQSAEPSDATLRARSNVVLVPALVLDKAGNIVRGLTADDFIIEENGAAQPLRLDESPEAQAISLVVAVQRGRSAALQLQSIRRPGEDARSETTKKRRHHEAALGGLADMIEYFAGEGDCEVAMLTFDSTTDVFQRFTHELPAVLDRVQDLTPTGDPGAALLDAVERSLTMLERRDPRRTRVLLLISEERDHGSQAKLDDVVTHIARSNTLIYSVSFSPLRAETLRDLKDSDGPISPGVNFLKLLGLAANGFQRNSARAIAQLTGGEYSTFKDKHSFEDEIIDLANHVRGRYLLSFQPPDLKPGAHRFTVRLRHPEKGASIVARNSYWMEGETK